MNNYRLILLLACIPLWSASTAGQQRLPIIDMHMHVSQVVLGADGKPIPAPCDPQPCQGASTAATTPEEVRRLTLQLMDRYNIVTGVLSSQNHSDVYAWVATAPGRFIASPFISKPGEPAIELLRREYAAGRLAAMGEIGTQYSGISPSDPALDAYFALAEERNVPALIHTLGFGAHLPKMLGRRHGIRAPKKCEPIHSDAPGVGACARAKQ